MIDNTRFISEKAILGFLILLSLVDRVLAGLGPLISSG